MHAGQEWRKKSRCHFPVRAHDVQTRRLGGSDHGGEELRADGLPVISCDCVVWFHFDCLEMPVQDNNEAIIGGKMPTEKGTNFMKKML